MRRVTMPAVIVATLLIFIACTPHAQVYPSRPIHFVVPFPPGGGNDIVARLIAQQLSESIKQPVIVDNRGGAGGIVGAEMIAKARGDGYTIGMGSTSVLTINPGLFKNLPYDAIKDFAPITLVATAPYLLTIHPSVPARTFTEFIALARAKPGALRFSSSGTATTNHLAGEILNSMMHINLLHVPYKGAGPAMVDVIAGQVEVTFGPMVSSLSFARNGQLRALAVTSPKRSPVALELPTIAESGVPGYEVVNWYGIVAPASTPKAVIDRLNREIVAMLNSKSLKDRLVSDGADVVANSPAAFNTYIKAEMIKWGKAIRDSGIKME